MGWQTPVIVKYVPVYKGGKGKWGGRSKGKGKKRTPYSELPEEKKEAIKAKHQSRADDEGRTELGNILYEGVVTKRFKKNGWIKPSNLSKFPKNVQTKMKEMTAEFKAKAIEHDQDGSFFDSPLVYLRMCDVTEGVPIEKDMKVKFKLYMDEKGVGAHEVVAA